MPAVVRRLCDQESTGPRGVALQSNSRHRAAISPGPSKTLIVTPESWIRVSACAVGMVIAAVSASAVRPSNRPGEGPRQYARGTRVAHMLAWAAAPAPTATGNLRDYTTSRGPISPLAT